MPDRQRKSLITMSRVAMLPAVAAPFFVGKYVDPGNLADAP